MEYLIIHKDEPIGKVVEPKADLGMGVVIGSFVPFPAYENVRQMCRMYAKLVESGQADAEQVNHSSQASGALDLSLTTMDGLPVETLWIRIEDSSEELGDKGYEAHFCVNYADGVFFDDGSLWNKEESDGPVNEKI
jgi:hypothetical protein